MSCSINCRKNQSWYEKFDIGTFFSALGIAGVSYGLYHAWQGDNHSLVWVAFGLIVGQAGLSIINTNSKMDSIKRRNDFDDFRREIDNQIERIHMRIDDLETKTKNELDRESSNIWNEISNIQEKTTELL